VDRGASALAAWVPFREADGWNAAAVGTAWIEQRSAIERAAPVLVTATPTDLHAIPPLARFARRYRVATPSELRFERRERLSPLLVLGPDVRALSAVTRAACGTSLCVVERPHFSVRGWASATGALDLTGSVVPQPPSLLVEAVVLALQRQPDGETGAKAARQQVVRLVHEFHQRGLGDREFLLGFAAARGVPSRTIAQISAASLVVLRSHPC
jgi:hypothetical protein